MKVMGVGAVVMEALSASDARAVRQRRARVVVDQRSGTIVMGSDVRISRVAVAQGGLTLRIEDQGAASGGETVDLTITVDDGEPATFQVPVNQDLQLPVTLDHGGMNVLQFATPAQDGELTDRNNAAVVQINGVRDRLRVLLVSGEPHAGERVWRNLLKSDAAVDLVHFTILRPPEKQDGIPVSELSLIAFPTKELFVDKIKDFDLIIFDRYRMRGILPMEYLDNVVS